VTTINGSRGEITLQPDTSGSYTYTFTSLSDANYQNIKLGGPVIKQTVYPLASAMFVGARTPHGKNVDKIRETTVQSCAGDVVDVPVGLTGTAPWNLELQLVSPAGTETTRATGITNNQHTLKLKIPKDIDRDGGTILVDLSGSFSNALRGRN
jgi:nucleoporin POM152